MRDINDMIKNSLVSKGDTSKIKKVFEKAESGQDITVAFLGGSITQGCNAKIHEDSYAFKTYTWFRDRFRNIKVKYVNAGVGATDSILGVHRVKKQVLDENPDIIFIDFAVNDKSSKFHKVAYESLIRRILSVENPPAIIEVFMSTFNGENVQEQQIEIGRKYNIPMVSFRNAVYREMKKGTLVWEDVASDEVHPNGYGHFVISELLIDLLQNIDKEVKEEEWNLELGSPIFGDKYINGKRIDNKTVKVIECNGFIEDKYGFQVFDNGWNLSMQDRCMGKLVVEIEGKNIFLVYKKSIKENAGKIQIKVDEKESQVIDTFFKNGWGDYTETEVIVESEEWNKYVIEIISNNEEITLLGFLVS